MNPKLTAKRDEMSKVIARQVIPESMVDRAELWSDGFDTAIQVVTEMLGEFDEETATTAIDSGIHRANATEWISALHGARWMHSEILKKLGAK